MNSNFINELKIIFFKQMTLIIKVEEKLLKSFSEGLLAGTTHTSIGQEACAVGVINALDRNKDIIFSNLRNHGHYLAHSMIYGVCYMTLINKDK
ncbi:MAG: hypothetical protein HQ534_07640 [Armatimonadetes bacterium]|nr:hypothetical protein [Armatimonadota bacterium]